MDSKQEEPWEKRDRTWRRWSQFLWNINIKDAYLDAVSPEGRRLLAKCFLVVYRSGTFDKEGRSIGKRKKPMVAATI